MRITGTSRVKHLTSNGKRTVCRIDCSEWLVDRQPYDIAREVKEGTLRLCIRCGQLEHYQDAMEQLQVQLEAGARENKRRSAEASEKATERREARQQLADEVLESLSFLLSDQPVSQDQRRSQTILTFRTRVQPLDEELVVKISIESQDTAWTPVENDRNWQDKQW